MPGASAGQVQTVLGAVPASDLGITLPHEHLLLDLRRVFVEPEAAEELLLAHAPVGLENLSWVMMNWCRCRDNLVLDDPELAIEEAMRFKHAGGGTIVDVTSVGLGRRPAELRRIALSTGLHVVMGASYYYAFFHPPGTAEKSEEVLCEEIVTDLTVGADGTGIRGGIIGEVGCSWPLDPVEERILRASARAQRRTGAPITIHPGRHVEAPTQIMDILIEAGAEADGVIMGHVERNGLNRDQLMRLAGSGCYVEFDWFGEVRPTHPYGIVNVPSDGERLDRVADLVANGYGKQVLISQDVAFKTRLAAFGGPGYAHIPRYVQAWMRVKEFTEPVIEDILIGNPGRAIRFG